MEVIQAPQPGPTAAWADPPHPLHIHHHLLLTPGPLPLNLTAGDPSPPCLLNGTLGSSNWTMETDGGAHVLAFLPVVAGVIIPLVYITVCVVGLVGNTLVIHVVLRHTQQQQSQSVTNLYILNLALADQLFMLGLPFLAVQNALLSWPFGAPACRAVMTLDAINQFTSIFCLTVMSVDRYLAVAHPLRCAAWRRPCVAKMVNCAVWVASSLVVLPVVVFAGVLEDDGTCGIVWPEPSEVWKASFIVYTTAVGFLCPLLVICLCYLLIVVKVRSAGKRVQATSSRRRKSERKITRMVVVVVAVFVLCWLPFYVLNIVNLLVVLPGDLQGVYYFVVVLSYANSCANPILYGFLSDSFKRGFRKALCRSSRRVESHERACVQTQRPTEEWGGTAPQQHNGVDVAGAHRGRGEEQEEEDEEMERGDGATQMTEICGIVHCAENAAEDARTLLVHGPEPVDPRPRDNCGEEGTGNAPRCPSQPSSTLASNVESGKTDESVDLSTILEVSSL